MNKKIFSLIIFGIGILFLTGCGGGGDSDSDSTNPVGNNSTTTTISGTVAVPEINDGLLGSVRKAAGSAIDYSKLKIQVSGDSSTLTKLSLDGTFSIGITTLATNSLVLEIKNAAGNTILGKKLFNVVSGVNVSSVQVDATSTAVLGITNSDSRWTESNISIQNAAAEYSALMTAILNFLKNGTSGGVFSDSAVGTAVINFLDLKPSVLTISGTVAVPEINDGLLGSVRNAAGSAIDYSKLKIQVSGDSSTLTKLSLDGTFSIGITTLATNSLVLEIKNTAGNTILGKKLFNVVSGVNVSSVQVDATSTAVLKILGTSSTWTESDISGQNATTQYSNVMTAVLNFLKNTTGGDVLTDSTVGGAVTTFILDLQPGEKMIREAYAAMKAALENNSLSADERLQAFMANVSPDFKDIAGTPNYAELQSSTLSRFQRYQINSYSFEPKSVTYISSDTIQVVTGMFIDVTRLPGVTTGYSALSLSVLPDPTIIWKYNGTKWLILQGLPYKSSEITI